MEYCYLAAHVRRKGVRETAFMEKAKTLSRQFGDVFVYNYDTQVKKISRIG